MRSTVAVAVLFASTAGFWIGTAAAQGAAAAPPPGARQRCLALNNLKIPAFLNALGQGPVPSTWPTNQDATQYAEASGTVRYVITRDVTADPLAFDSGKWATRITESRKPGTRTASTSRSS